MFSENGLTGKALVDATTRAIMVRLSLTQPVAASKIRPHVVDAYEGAEYFDGEPTDPEAFAGRVIERMKWKEAL
jgi:hypothetical protein